jgi:hypothetical protein
VINDDKNIIPKKGQISGKPPQSKVDLFSGDHTASIIVAILFIIVFIGLVTYVCAKEKYENIIINGFFSLLSLLGGFFVGSQMKKR